MAFLLSPGASISEIDLSTYVPAGATTGGVLAGPFTWGPANVKTLVDSETTLVNVFGEPSNDTADVFFTADSFLQYGNNLNVVRVLPLLARNAAVINDGITRVAITTAGAGYVHVPTLSFSSGSATATATVASGEITSVTITSPGSGYSLTSPPTITVTPTGGDSITLAAVLVPYVGLQIQNETDYLNNYAAGQSNAGQFCAKYAGTKGNGLQIFICDDPNQFATWPYNGYFSSAPGTSTYTENLGGSGDELHLVVVDSVGIISGVPGTVLETFGFVSKAVDAQNAQGASIYYPNVLDRTSKWVRWLEFPTTVFNWGTTARNTVFDSYYVNGAAAFLDVLSTGQGLIFTAKTPGTVGNAITVQYTNPGVDGTISVGVTSNAINVTLAYSGSNITSTAAQVKAAVDAYPAAAALVSTAYAVGYVGTDVVTAFGPTNLAGGINAGGDFASLNVFTGNKGITYTAKTVGAVGNSITVTYTDPGGTSTTLGVVVTGTAINVNLGRAASAINTTAAALQTLLAGTPAVTNLVTAVLDGNGATLLTAQSTTPLAGGFDPASYVYLLEGGNDANDTVTTGEIINGYDLFNVDDFKFGLIMTASHDATVVDHCITEIAETRMDSVVFVSPPSDTVVNNAGNEATDIVTYRNTLPSSSYAFMDSNWIYKYDKWNDVFRYVPSNGDVAGLCVRTDQTRDPWSPPAGLNRGGIKGAVGLAWDPKQAYRDVLYQAGVKPIVSFAGQGVVLFGDKTMLSKPSAFDRINVRRLFIVIEQAIAITARYTLFELNDEITRAQFVGLIDPFLRDIQGRRGLYAYDVVCDSSNNTPDMIDMNQFQGDIYLQPTKSINFIQLNFIATRTGIDFNEIVGQF